MTSVTSQESRRVTSLVALHDGVDDVLEGLAGIGALEVSQYVQRLTSVLHTQLEALLHTGTLSEHTDIQSEESLTQTYSQRRPCFTPGPCPNTHTYSQRRP